MLMNVLILSDKTGFGSDFHAYCSGLDFLINHFQFSNPDDAEIAVESLLPDFLISEDEMPGGSGIEFCRKIKEIFDIPFVIISESPSYDKAVESVKAGAEDYLPKKKALKEKLLDTLKQSLEKKKSHVIPLYGPRRVKSGEIYARVFEFISDACFIVDDETGFIMEANRAAMSMYAYSRREFTSMVISFLFSEPDIYWQISSDEVSGIYEFEHRKKNGALFPVEMTFSRVQLEGKIFALITVRDISLRRRAEDLLRRQHEALLKTNRFLEAQASELESQKRSMELKNRELEKIQKQLKDKAKDLETASMYKSEFLANMSHELRTPLNSILVLSKLIAENRERNLTPRQIDFIETVINAANDLSRLINDVLDMSKVEAGKMELCPSQIEVRAFIDFFSKQCRHLAEEKNLFFDIFIDEEVPQYVITDQHRLEQVLKNFISNSIKFTESGGISINVSVSGHMVTGEKLLSFSVRDTGIGIPIEKQETIFDAFMQADGSISRKYGGTGLGLSISKKIAVLLGGYIRLESKPGKGSEFTLILPEKLEGCDAAEMAVHEQLAFEMDDAEEFVALVEQEDAGIQEKTIAMISDDPDLVSFFEKNSRTFGYSVARFFDNSKIISSLEAYPRVAVVLDTRGRKDAWGILARIKENVALRHIPVFVVARSEDRVYAIKLGARFVIDGDLEDIDINSFYGMVEKYSDYERQRRLLVIEDDPVQKSLISKIIDSSKIDITMAETAAEAAHLLERDEYDCMILDLGLPDMSGIDLLNKIRSSERMSHVPIIIYTGRELVSDEKITIDDYAEKIIVKGAKSLPRLLDDATLFLHCRDTDIKPERRNLLYSIHDSRQILKDKRVLIVDDDMRHVFIISSILENSGLVPFIARDSQRLDAIIRKNERFDLVLMDISLMLGDCMVFVDHFHTSPDFKNVPLIAMTGERGDLKGRDNCLKAGANDYLVKPVDEDRLLGMLRTWLY